MMFYNVSGFAYNISLEICIILIMLQFKMLDF